MSTSSMSDRIAFASMLASVFVTGVAYGVGAFHKGWFPAPQIQTGLEAVQQVVQELQPKWFVTLDGPEHQEDSLTSGKHGAGRFELGDVAPGLVLLVGVDVTEEGPRNFVHVIDREGEIVHAWYPNWFEVWGDEGEFREERRPQSQPGAAIHGAALAANGDIIFNFDLLSTVRMSACGEVIWRLDNLGHHSVDIDEHDNIWVPAETYYAEGDTGQQNHNAPLRSWTIQQISPTGEILRTVEVLDILRKNDLLGLMHMSNLSNNSTEVEGDTLHLNDVEIFPSGFKSSVFAPGDVMISLRNINSVLVLDSKMEKVKFQATGQFLRQHDPDFVSGDRILVYDNRNLTPSKGSKELASRIVELDVTSGEANIFYEGTGEGKFFSPILGKHELLNNGNLIITSSVEGRAFEVDKEGRLLWFYNNVTPEGKNALLLEASVLPEGMDKQFFSSLQAACDEG